jgi:hypothetical protein
MIRSSPRSLLLICTCLGVAIGCEDTSPTTGAPCCDTDAAPVFFLPRTQTTGGMAESPFGSAGVTFETENPAFP